MTLSRKGSNMAKMSNGAGSRVRAVQEVLNRVPRVIDRPKDSQGRELPISSFYGINVFDEQKMKDKLPKEVFQKLMGTIQTGKKLDLDIANSVAHAVKEWALSNGVTHFCHWFQPQTGGTAEKHDAFLSIEARGAAVEKFSGAQLIQSEPDASSFPSGGMRTTFEARGYTAWDPSSPMFINESAGGKTLCIPSVFISYYGHALDEKTGLIRSMEHLSNHACELLALLGDKDVRRVTATMGAEQEYFLIDRAFVGLRQDLQMSGRCLIGRMPPKGQQLEDHYFGSIPPRVQAFMNEAELELYKLGVPVKTRHNEVAPNQFESAPIFEEVNVASDHNQLVMETLRKVARRHHYEVLFHEKPFAGVNGSGKHCNWSMQVTLANDDLEGLNLLDPGNTPHQNLRFLAVLVATLRGVHKHAGLLRAGIASGGNDHRLGANEAPPAIISVFLGSQLDRILNELERGTDLQDTNAVILKLGVSKLPELMRDNTDRNRTSPFAFTGNKFEFRAVGSSANISFPVSLVNVAVADGIQELIQRVKSKLNAASRPEDVILGILREMVRESKSIRFEGNNYSDEWVVEAAKRGLPNLRKTPEALAQIISTQSKALLIDAKVYSESELVSRYHVRVEAYVKRLFIEAETLLDIAETQILPACLEYQHALCDAAVSAKAAGVSTTVGESLDVIGGLMKKLRDRRLAVSEMLTSILSETAEEIRAERISTDLAPKMDSLRETIDALEGIVSDDLWPLPKYRELLLMQ